MENSYDEEEDQEDDEEDDDDMPALTSIDGIYLFSYLSSVLYHLI
jgi:hypothetical protein